MRNRLLIVLAVAVAAGFLIGRAVSPKPEGASARQTAPPQRAAPLDEASSLAAEADRSAPVPEDLTTEEKRNIDVFRRASDSVVHITTSVLERDFFSLDVMQIPRGTGSGIVWDRDGHIVTNFHVIEGGDRFKVRLSDQSAY